MTSPAQAGPAPADRGLPLGVYLLAALRLLDAAFFAAAVTGDRPLVFDELLASRLGGEEVLHAIYAIVAVLSVLAAIGLLIGHRWGWAGTMLLTGFGLLITIYAYVAGAGSDLRLILLVVSALYLNQRVVRERFWDGRT